MIDYHKIKSVIATNATKRDVLIETVREIVEGMGEGEREAAEAKLAKVLTNYIRRVHVDRVGIVTSFLCDRTQASPGMVNYKVFREEFESWCKATQNFEVGQVRMTNIIHKMGYETKLIGKTTYLLDTILKSGAGTRPGLDNGKVKRGRPKGSKNKPNVDQVNSD